MLERQRGIARHGEEAPRLVSRLGIVGGDIAAHAVFGAAVADEHLAGRGAGRAGDGVVALTVDEGVHFPHLLAGGGIQRDQPAVQRADVNAPLVNGDAAVHHVAAGAAAPLWGHFGVVRPHFLASERIDGMHPAPSAGEEHDAVHDDGGGLEGAAGAHVAVPGEAQFADGVAIDGREWREAAFFVGAPVGEPVAGLRIRVDDAGVVDEADGWRRSGRCLGRCGCGFGGGGWGRFLAPAHPIGDAGDDDENDGPNQSAHPTSPRFLARPIIRECRGRGQSMRAG